MSIEEPAVLPRLAQKKEKRAALAHRRSGRMVLLIDTDHLGIGMEWEPAAQARGDRELGVAP